MTIAMTSIGRNQRRKPPRIVLHGTGGIGKSSFGASAPAPIFISTEEGLINIPADAFYQDRPIPIAESSQDVLDALSLLYHEEHPYKTVVLDSVDWLETIIIKEIEESYDAKELAYGKSQMKAAEQLRVILEWFTALNAQKNMMCILIAHTQIERIEPPDTDAYDRYAPKLQRRSNSILMEWCDFMGFLNYKTSIMEEKGEFGSKRKRGTSTGVRLIYTSERPTHLAKNRYNMPDSLPFERLPATAGGVWSPINWAPYAEYLPMP